MAGSKAESNLPAVSYTKVVWAQAAKITILPHPRYLGLPNIVNYFQGKERAMSQRLMRDFCIKKIQKIKKKIKKRNYTYEQNHIQPSQSAGMSVLTDGST